MNQKSSLLLGVGDAKYDGQATYEEFRVCHLEIITRVCVIQRGMTDLIHGFADVSHSQSYVHVLIKYITGLELICLFLLDGIR